MRRIILQQHIATFFYRQSEKTQSESETRLNIVVDCIRFLFKLRASILWA